MKRRSILAFGLILFIGLLALPQLSVWIVRDFVEQTMRIEGDFEDVSVDPINGKLVLRNLALHHPSVESSLAARPINRVEKVWADFSLPKLLHRRFESPLIVMDGLEIGYCDKSSMMLPSFQPKAIEESAQGDQLLLNASDSDFANNLAFQASLKNALEPTINRSAVSSQHIQSELDRLRRDANLLSVTQLETGNPLRSELEAKKLRFELDRIAGELKDISATLERDASRASETVPLAKERILVDWMTWNDARLAETEAIDIEPQLRSMLSAYASELIKPILPSLITTHAISRWSVGESNDVLEQATNSKRNEVFDRFFARKDVPPFAFRQAKLRGRTLLGNEPLAMSGTVKSQSVPQKNSSDTNVPTQSSKVELSFTDAINPQPSGEFSSKPFVAAATYTPGNSTQKIALKHHDNRMVNQLELPFGTAAEGIRAKIRSVDPKSELTWALQGDCWNCTFKAYGSDIQIDLVNRQTNDDLSLENSVSSLNPMKRNVESPFKLYRSKAHSLETESPFFEVKYTGKLDGERFDNCNETVDCEQFSALTQSIKEYLIQRTQTELIALKEQWLKQAGEQVAQWQESNSSRLTLVKQDLSRFEQDIATQQSRLGEILSNPSEARFARKNLQDKSDTLTR